MWYRITDRKVASTVHRLTRIADECDRRAAARADAPLLLASALSRATAESLTALEARKLEAIAGVRSLDRELQAARAVALLDVRRVRDLLRAACDDDPYALAAFGVRPRRADRSRKGGGRRGQ